MASITIRIAGHADPVSVRVTDAQRAEVERHAGLAGLPVSRWVRETLDAARRERSHEDAAESAGLDLRSWIRVLVLERAGETDLRAQLADAYAPHLAAPPTRPQRRPG